MRRLTEDRPLAVWSVAELLLTAREVCTDLHLQFLRLERHQGELPATYRAFCEVRRMCDGLEIVADELMARAEVGHSAEEIEDVINADG